MDRPTFDTRDNCKADPEEIEKALAKFMQPATLLELRALGFRKGQVASGYFDSQHLREMVNEAEALSGKNAGVYFSLNPVHPDLIARAANRVNPHAAHATKSSEIVRRKRLLIDVDSKRRSGMSATKEELHAALACAAEIRQWLRDKGWPDPLYNMSGNGAHLFYWIDLPNDDAATTMVEGVLKAIAVRHNSEKVTIDQSVHDAARIARLPGTLACKGDHINERPHRIARNIEAPSRLECVTPEQLEALAGEVVVSANPGMNGLGFVLFDIDLAVWLAEHKIAVANVKNKNGSQLYELERCIWRPDQSDGGPWVLQNPDGKICAGCHHSKCQDKGWEEMRDVVEPGWRKVKSKKGSDKKPSVAVQIVASAASDEFFHTPEQVAYVTIKRGGHRENWKVKGKQYRLILRGRLHEKGIVARDTALGDAVSTLEGNALHSGPEQAVYVRTAQVGDKYYLDLCNEAWEAVEISVEGWRIITEVGASSDGL